VDSDLERRIDGPNVRRLIRLNGLLISAANGWGNNELETYTNRAANADLEGGFLSSKRSRRRLRDRQHTAQLHFCEMAYSQQVHTGLWTFEARIKIPYGQGLWPAFWMLGDNINTAGWPTRVPSVESAMKQSKALANVFHDIDLTASGHPAVLILSPNIQNAGQSP